MPDVFTASASHILKDYFADFRRAVTGLPDEAINWRPAGEDTNSFAVLVTHTLHSTRSWISIAVGAPLPERDRDSEFEVKAASAADLLRLLDDFEPEIRGLLDGAPEVDWTANRKTHMRPDPDLPDYVPAAFAIMHAVEHFSQHVGHIGLTRQIWDTAHA
jgi:uncharacterized damage-inducible protein DinB